MSDAQYFIVEHLRHEIVWSERLTKHELLRRWANGLGIWRITRDDIAQTDMHKQFTTTENLRRMIKDLAHAVNLEVSNGE